ncbi:MAG: tetratricopeptide repeat protein [Limisphaerales bacterium]
MGFHFERTFCDDGQAEGARQITAVRRQLRESTSDADGYLRLGALYDSAHDTNNSAQAYAKAVELYRLRVESHPDNGPLLADYGRALSEAGRESEAEQVLRKAVMVAPQDWHGWAASAELRADQAWKALWPRARDEKNFASLTFTSPGGQDPVPAWIGEFLKQPPSAAQMRRAQELDAEASRDFELAVAWAPADPGVYEQRVYFDFRRAWFLSLGRALRDHSTTELTWQRILFSPEMRADLRRVACLTSSNYLAIGVSAFGECTAGWQTNLSVPASPRKTRRYVRWAVARLKALSEESNPQRAAGAFTTMGLLMVMLENESGSLAAFRRAVALDPASDQASDMLVFALATSERWADLLAVCQQRVKRSDTARNRLFLARAYLYRDRDREAENELRRAAKMGPENFTTDLSLAALLLKRNDDRALPETGEWLIRAYGLIGTSDCPNGASQQNLDYALTTSIYCGLTGDVDSARQCLKTVLDADRGNGRAKKILAVLGGQ